MPRTALSIWSRALTKSTGYRHFFWGGELPPSLIFINTGIRRRRRHPFIVKSSLKHLKPWPIFGSVPRPDLEIPLMTEIVLVEKDTSILPWSLRQPLNAAVITFKALFCAVVKVKNESWGNCTSALPPPNRWLWDPERFYEIPYEAWERWIAVTGGTGTDRLRPMAVSPMVVCRWRVAVGRRRDTQLQCR